MTWRGAGAPAARTTVFRILLPAVGAVTTALAVRLYARVEWPWFALGWVGLVPWLATLDRSRSFASALGSGCLMSEAFVFAVFSWFPGALRDYGGAPWAVVVPVTALLAPLLQPQFLACALARQAAQRRRAAAWRIALVSAAAYSAADWACPKLFFDTLGHGVYASVLMRQAADLAGAHGLTFALVAANECVLAAVTARRDGAAGVHRAVVSLGCAAGIAGALLGYGVLRIHQLNAAAAKTEPVTAGVVQADISHYDRLAAQIGTFDAVRMILDTHFALSTQVEARARLDFLVWPETVYPTTFGTPKSPDGAAFDREISGFVARAGLPLVFGTYDAESGHEFNAAVFLEPSSDGRLTFDTYRKSFLFPLTERVPAILDTPAVRHWLPWMGSWTPGPGPKVIALSLAHGRELRIAPLICYDALVPAQTIAAVRGGAEAIVTLSNDSWFAWDGVQRLILILSAFRSIETRRPQIRAANTGISAVITPTGKLLDSIDKDVRGTLPATVTPEAQATTLMLAWGDWFGPAALCLCAVLLVVPPRKQFS